MTKTQYYKLNAGDIVKVNDRNIYLKVEFSSPDRHQEREVKYAKIFRVMFKEKDEYMNVDCEDITLIKKPFLQIFNEWYKMKQVNDFFKNLIKKRYE